MQRMRLFVPMNPEKVCVAKNKKSVLVLSYGGPPFFHAGNGIIIPHNFQVETYVAGQLFIAYTKVEKEADRVSYRFELKRNRAITSEWEKSPTGALSEINRIIGNKKFRIGTNGQLPMAVTYKPVQRRIRQVHRDEIRKVLGGELQGEEEENIEVATPTETKEKPTEEKTPPKGEENKQEAAMPPKEKEKEETQGVATEEGEPTKRAKMEEAERTPPPLVGASVSLTLEEEEDDIWLADEIIE